LSDKGHVQTEYRAKRLKNVIMEAVFIFFQLFGKNQNGYHSAIFGAIDLRIETCYLTDKGHVET